jgi:hypothetical protein
MTLRADAENIMSRYGAVTIHNYNPDSTQGARTLAYAIVEVEDDVLGKMQDDESIEIELMPDISNTCRRKSGGCGCK